MIMYPIKECLIDQEVFINIVHNSISNCSFNSSQLQTLHLLLELHLHNSPGTPKELLLQVTDESDPLLLLTTSITENGYQSLRSSQGLLVDFNSFPHHFANLIKRCLQEQKNEAAKFALVLRTTGNEIPVANDGGIGKVCLEVVELNAFKHLCHLSLNLTPATLQTKLAHLSSCIKILKNSICLEREKSQQEVTRLTENVETLEGRHSAKEAEYEARKEELQRKMNEEVEKYSSLLMQEKEAALKSKSDCDRRMARDKRELESKFGEQIRHLKEENSSLRKRISEMNTKYELIEDSLRETKLRLKDAEDKSKRHVKELNNLAKERSELQRESDIKEESNRKLVSQVAQQEKNIQELEQVIKHNSTQFASLHHQKNSLEDSFNSCQAKLEKREDNLRKLLVDFQKSLEIIRKFKQKIKSDEEKIDSLLTTSETQGEELRRTQETLRKTKEESEDLSKRMATRELELQEKETKLKEATDKILSQEMDLKKNENVISWLNKRLNEIEATEVIMKKAPLTEAYLHTQSVRNPYSACTPTLTSSTPMSTHSAPPNFTGSAQSKVHSLSSVPPLGDIPKIPEEIGPSPSEDKENSNGLATRSGGLDTRYLEPSKQTNPPLPVRGILRANAVVRPEAKTEHDAKNLKKSVKTKNSERNKGSKVSSSKQSAYFAKT